MKSGRQALFRQFKSDPTGGAVTKLCRSAARHGARAAVAALAVVALLGYLPAHGRSPAPGPGFEKLRIAVPLVPHAAMYHLAAAKGYFDAENLEVTTVPAVHGKEALDLVMQGKADLATASEFVFVLAALRKAPVAIVASIMSSTNDLAVVARKDRGILEPRDIAGKKVGVTEGTAGEYFLWAFLIRHKLPRESVKLVGLPPAATAASLASGTVDAISTWEPNVTAAQLGLGAGTVTFHEPLAYAETFNLVGRTEFIERHPSAVEKLLRALIRAEQFSQAHPKEAVALVADRLKIDPAALQSTWKKFEFRVELRQSLLNTMEEQASWAVARGDIGNDSIPNFFPALHLKSLLDVGPERVTVMH